MSVDQTPGANTQRKFIRDESYALVLHFPPASGQNLSIGQLVKLNNAGEVTGIAASTDQSLGVVVSNYQGNDPGYVRVMTPFMSQQYVYADGVIDENQEVACTGFDATSGLPKFKAAATGDWVSGRCLAAAADTTTGGIVGLLRGGGYKKPA